MGGECNYLLRVAGKDRRLEFVPDAEWKSAYMMSWQVRAPPWGGWSVQVGGLGVWASGCMGTAAQRGG